MKVINRSDMNGSALNLEESVYITLNEEGKIEIPDAHLFLSSGVISIGIDHLADSILGERVSDINKDLNATAQITLVYNSSDKEFMKPLIEAIHVRRDALMKSGVLGPLQMYPSANDESSLLVFLKQMESIKGMINSTKNINNIKRHDEQYIHSPKVYGDISGRTVYLFSPFMDFKLNDQKLEELKSYISMMEDYNNFIVRETGNKKSLEMTKIIPVALFVQGTYEGKNYAAFKAQYTESSKLKHEYMTEQDSVPAFMLKKQM